MYIIFVLMKLMIIIIALIIIKMKTRFHLYVVKREVAMMKLVFIALRESVILFLLSYPKNYAPFSYPKNSSAPSLKPKALASWTEKSKKCRYVTPPLNEGFP